MPGTQSPIAGRRSSLLALLICVAVLSLVTHLNHRYSEAPVFTAISSLKCSSLQPQWQYLERHSADWAAPAAESRPFYTPLEERLLTTKAAIYQHVWLADATHIRPPPARSLNA